MRSATLLALFLTSCMLLAAMPAAAQDIVVAGDGDGDKVVSPEELEIAEQLHKDGKITSDQLEEIRHIHENYPKTITDSAGREVTIWKPLRKIVVFNSETVEVMRSLMAQETIIGIGKYTKEDVLFFPETSKLPGVGSVWSPDCEAVLVLHPDAVFLYAAFSSSKAENIQKTIEMADPAITVVRLDCHKPESYVEEVETLGVILEREDEAREYLDFYQSCVDGITDSVSGLSEDEKPRVYLESWSDYRTCTQGAGWHQKLVMAGGNNIFGDMAVSYADVEPESVIVRDPEVVIKLCGAGKLKFGGYGEDDTSGMEDLLENVINRPGWDNVTSVRNGDVYMLSNDILGGAKYFIGVAYMAKLFHPDLFEEIDPEAIHQEYLTRFQGLDYSLDEQGVFVYPEMT